MNFQITTFLIINAASVFANEDPDLLRYHGDAKALALGLSPSGEEHSAPIHYSPPPKIELPAIPYNPPQPPAIPYNPPAPVYHVPPPAPVYHASPPAPVYHSPPPAPAPPPCVHAAPIPLFTPSFAPVPQIKLGVTYAQPPQGYKVTEGLSSYGGIAVSTN